MLCAERHVLLSDYQETARVYADSVRKMTDLVGLGIDSEVALLRRRSERGRGIALRFGPGNSRLSALQPRLVADRVYQILSRPLSADRHRALGPALLFR